MAKCDYCGKEVKFGIKVSHSHRRSNRTWKPNIMRVKAIVNGTPKTVYVCSRCLRSGKVERVIRPIKIKEAPEAAAPEIVVPDTVEIEETEVVEAEAVEEAVEETAGEAVEAPADED